MTIKYTCTFPFAKSSSYILDHLISLVNSVAHSAIERSESRYFQNGTAPRDSACKSVLEKLNLVLSLLSNYPRGNSNEGPFTTQITQSWHAPCIFNGSGSGKTFFNHFLQEHIRDYTSKNPTVIQTWINIFRVLIDLTGCSGGFLFLESASSFASLDFSV